MATHLVVEMTQVSTLAQGRGVHGRSASPGHLVAGRGETSPSTGQ